MQQEAERQVAAHWVRGWKINQALYREFGGRIIFLQQAGWEPIDAYRKLLDRYAAKKAFMVHDPALRDAVYGYFQAQIRVRRRDQGEVLLRQAVVGAHRRSSRPPGFRARRLLLAEPESGSRGSTPSMNSGGGRGLHEETAEGRMTGECRGRPYPLSVTPRRAGQARQCAVPLRFSRPHAYLLGRIRPGEADR